MALKTIHRNLLPFHLVEGAIQFTGIEIFEEPGSFIGLVSFTENGKSGAEALRLDFGKICFLDIQPFEATYGEHEGRRRANQLAYRVMQQLAEPQSLSAQAHGD